MANKFGIPEKELLSIRERDKNCVYCGKEMISPCIGNKQRNWATIEHLNRKEPFYWKDGLKSADVVICCGSCNSSRGAKRLFDWFQSEYCIKNNINEETVTAPVIKYLKTKRALE